LQSVVIISFITESGLMVGLECLRSRYWPMYDAGNQRDLTGGQRATSGQRQFVTRPAELFVNLLLVTTSSFILFTPKDLKIVVIFISSAALRTSAIHATDCKTLP
jgi:hypothetical protein